jgi:hypothetical protein
MGIGQSDCVFHCSYYITSFHLGKSLNDDGGKTNPLCGEPKNMNNIPKHTFRCEQYGRYVTVKKTIIPAIQYHLIFLEVLVNKEPTRKLALSIDTCVFKFARY